MKKFLSKITSIILCISILAGILPILKVNTKAVTSSAVMIDDESIDLFINLFYGSGADISSDTADKIRNILNGYEQASLDELIDIIGKTTKFYSIFVPEKDFYEGFVSAAANHALNDMSIVNNMVGGVIDIYKNSVSYRTNTVAARKAIDAIQMFEGVVRFMGFSKYFPPQLSAIVSSAELAYSIADYLQRAYLKEALVAYEGDLMLAYYLGDPLPEPPERPVLIPASYPDEEIKQMFSSLYIDYVIKKMVDTLGKHNGSSGGGSVTPPTPPDIEVSSVQFKNSSYDISSNMCVKLPVYTYPSNATVGTSVSYSSSNTSVATVDSTGKITAVSPGIVSIYATSSNGIKGECKITVLPYNVEEVTGGYRITKYLGKSSSVNIPKTIAEKNVVEIGKGAFHNNKTSIGVIIPNTVKTIGERAFYGCGSLNSVVIPNSVTSIGDYTFSECTSLTSVTIPNSVTSIGDYAFDACINLASITIPGSVMSIGDDTFSYCTSLTNVAICEGVTSIGDHVFYGCASLERITIPDSLISIGDYTFSDCESLTSINIPKGVTSIGNGAFEWCTSLTSINIPEGVTSIGDYAFSGCTNLTNITIPNSVMSIGREVFRYCTSLTNITVKEGNTVYHSKNNCLIKTATNTLILGCKTSIIPNYVTSVGSYAFSGCTNLTSITIPNSVTSIEYYAFSGCTNLTSITIPNSVTSIEYYAFYYCTSLTSIIIPNSVTSVGEGVFMECTSLTSITLPDGVKSIGYNTFYNCTSLTSVTMPSSVDNIGGYAFYDCTSLTSITIPNGVINIEPYTFSGCTSLTSITIPNSVTIIEYSAFSGCKNLEKITIPDSATIIGDYAFYGCTSLTSINIPEGVTSIGYFAFYNCTSLTSINIPKGVTSIEYYTFDGCNKLKTVYYPCNKDIDSISIGGNNSYLTNAQWIAEHSLTDEVTKPTCTEQGYTTHTCIDCGYSHKDDYTLPIQHNYLEEITDPTCTQNGYTEMTCTVCGDNFKENLKDPLGHDMKFTETVPATSEAQGYDLYTCSTCGKEERKNFIDYIVPLNCIVGVKTTPSDVGVTLSWDAFDGAVEYYAKVYDKDFTKCLKTITTKGISAVFDCKVLNYNTDYKFIVTAKLDSGIYLQVADAIKIDGGMVIGNRVVGLTANIEGKGAVVNFIPLENATGYLLNVFENDANGQRVHSAILGADATSARIMNNLTAGTKYVVMINAKVDGKYMPLSDLRVNGIGVSFVAPIVNPSSVTIADQTATSIRFNWDAVRGATEYYVRVKEKETGALVNTLKAVGKTTATLSRYTDGTRISSNTTYTIEICAYISGISATYGDAIEITTIGYENVAVTAKYNSSNNKVNLSWNKTTNSIGYFVSTYKNGVKIGNKYIDGADNTVYEFSAPKTSGTYTYGVIAYEKNSSGTAYTPLTVSNAVTIK